MPVPKPDPNATVASRPSAVEPVELAAVAQYVDATVDGRGAIDGVAVTGVAQSSQRVVPGDLYVARAGAATHGARYLEAAEGAGAVAWLTDPEGAAQRGSSSLPMLVVDDARTVLGAVAAFAYGHPARALTVIGVTGTQGKTTTTRLLEEALTLTGRRTAVVGTMGTRIAGRPVASSLTTPEAPDLHALFAVMREQQVDVCAMEVSSHALSTGRVDGVVFDVAVFTNFGRDHLDFHPSVADYFAAKASLFTPERAVRGLISVDDAEVVALLDGAALPMSTFGVDGSRVHNAPDPEWLGSDVVATQTGSTFMLHGPGVEVESGVAIPGAFNVANAVCALAAIGAVGGPVEAAARALPNVAGVPGRMEPVDRGQRFAVVVDYAHKPDAVVAALEALRPVTPGRLVIVIGAGGDRDRGKRLLMGEVAARLADILVVTDDNPRTEEPASIRAELLGGAERQGGAELHEIGDRAAAIDYAIRHARSGDTVLIAGKGHETGQEIGAVVHPFDDRAVAAAALERVATGGPA